MVPGFIVSERASSTVVQKPDSEELMLTSLASLPPPVSSFPSSLPPAQAHIIFTLVTAIVWSLASLPSVRLISSEALLRIPQ